MTALVSVVENNIYASLELGDIYNAAWELNVSTDLGMITTSERCAILEDVRGDYGIDLLEYT